jgi:phosphoglycolate phosphatase-like HAD superfamily hydrolase
LCRKIDIYSPNRGVQQLFLLIVREFGVEIVPVLNVLPDTFYRYVRVDVLLFSLQEVLELVVLRVEIGLSGVVPAIARIQGDTRPGLTNLDKFRKEFESLYSDADHEAVWNRIEEFYATSFDNIHSVMGPNEPLHRSVEYLHSRGYHVLLTTNPIFPQVATYKHLTQASDTPASFEYISTMENCSACKPHIEYWQQVIRQMHVDPAQAVAVGNDCVIGDTAPSGADHISDALGFERSVLANY